MMDLWMGKNRQEYIGITCTYIDQHFKLNEVTLAVQYIRYPHTANHICETVEKILDDWNLSNKVYSITTDNAYNMKKAVSNMNDIIWQGCSSHTLQLVIGKALLPVEMLVARAKRLIDFFLRPKQSERLEEVQKRNPNKAAVV